MADSSASTTNAPAPDRSTIKIEEEWFQNAANQPVIKKRAMLHTIQEGFQMNDVEFKALRADFTKHIVEATASQGVFLGNKTQLDQHKALKSINIDPQRDVVARRRPRIPQDWQHSACFALLCQAMIEWRDAEVTNRDNSRSVNAHTFLTQTGHTDTNRLFHFVPATKEPWWSMRPKTMS